MAPTNAETAGSFSGFYAVKPASYFSMVRADFVDRLPRDTSAQILEVGCGTGATGALALSEGCCGRYVGVELFEAAAEQARDVLSDVVVGNVETLAFDWQPATFDAIIFSEVLEHLIDPAAVLKKLSRFVRPGGMLLASSPNIAHWRVIRELIMGRFQLTDQGVFDRTHLRWFTPESFAMLAENAGFDVEELGPVTPFSQRTEILSKMTGGQFDHLFMTQIAMLARRR
ncbi:MAG: class I SAM-dependent methyltransferase [Hyphomicrobium sp.]|nr:class I SAM-dependent methyltransferase [Hyphomicrobium sp.]